MAVGHLEKDSVNLLPGILNMLEDRNRIPIYTIINWKFTYLNASNPTDGIVVKIHLKRKILSEMATTYFPTILLVMITAATTHCWEKAIFLKVLFLWETLEKRQFLTVCFQLALSICRTKKKIVFSQPYQLLHNIFCLRKSCLLVGLFFHCY